MLRNASVQSLSGCIAQSDYPVCISSAALEPPGPTLCDINDAFARLIGCSRAELIGLTQRPRPEPLVERAVLEALKANLSAKDTYAGVIWGMRRDGIAHQVEWSVLALNVLGDDVDHLAWMRCDVNPGLAARQSLLDETERLYTLIQSVAESRSLDVDHPSRMAEGDTKATNHPVWLGPEGSRMGIAFIDRRRRICQVTSSLEAILGYSADEMIGCELEQFYVDHATLERLGAQAYARRGFGQDVLTYRAVFEGSRDAVILAAADGFFTAANPAALALFEVGGSAQFLREYGTPAALSPAIQPDGQCSADSAQRWIQKALDCGHSLFEWYHETASGRVFPAEVQLSRVDLDDGAIIQVTIRDISEKKAAMEALRQARDEAEAYFQAVPVMVLCMDLNGYVTQINQFGCDLLGLSREAIIGTPWFDGFLPPEERPELEHVFAALRRDDTETTEYHENQVVTANGKIRFIAFRNVLFRDSAGQIKGILASGIDVTRQREAEADLEYRAAHDELTGLCNRWRMMELLNAETQRVQRHGGVFSLVLFDVDKFKRINDEHGHDAGDTVLKLLAALVTQRLRKVDGFARWGGEEFLVLLPATDHAGGYKLAETLRRCVEGADFGAAGRVTISLGVVASGGDETVRQLLKRVDDRMYTGKRAGRNRTA